MRRFAGTRDAQCHDICLRQQGVQIRNEMHLIKATIRLWVGTAHADGISPYGFGAAGKLTANIACANDENFGTVNGMPAQSLLFPTMFFLLRTINGIVIVNAELHADHPFADNDAVGTGGIGKYGVLR